MKGKAVIAMSGGVDSSVAAWLMKEGDFDCIGVTLKLFSNDDIGIPENNSCNFGRRGCCTLEDVKDAKAVAFRLGMPHYVLNFSEEFKDQVIRRFIETYEAGETPNPCIDCNRYIKFEGLLRRTKQLDFDYMATGHYARIEQEGPGGRFLLKKARDGKKEQSYVLYTMTQEQVAHTRFPLGEMTKPQVREIALAQGFVNAKKQDSQDICFVPGGDYGRFIEEYTGKRREGGDIVDLAGNVLGKHRGLIRYTIGQRRGLGLSFPVPMYVSAKSTAANTLTLGPESSLYAKVLLANRLNLISRPSLDRPLRVLVKTRYLQAEQWAVAEQLAPDSLRVEFDHPQRAITAGQAVVLYEDDLVVGGGTILRAEIK
jgi:tRNA-specific 2-thiouridylase